MLIKSLAMFHVSTCYDNTLASLNGSLPRILLTVCGFQGPNVYDIQTCLAALFLTHPRDDREQPMHAKGSRVDGTCAWIKGHRLYRSWLYSPTQLLWLSGGPGKGKTALSIFLAEELEQTAKRFRMLYSWSISTTKRTKNVIQLRPI